MDEKLSTEKQLAIANAVARGLNHLHENNIVHRDLAARNILMHNGEAKISDFGLSRALKEEAQVGKTSSNMGPIRWMAPESIASQTYSIKSDVWMFGIILYEITARHEPHIGEDTLNIAIKIRDSGLTPTITEDSPPVLREIMEMCWQMDPSMRPVSIRIYHFNAKNVNLYHSNRRWNRFVRNSKNLLKSSPTD
jgi:serine/threonine protein kinase